MFRDLTFQMGDFQMAVGINHPRNNYTGIKLESCLLNRFSACTPDIPDRSVIIRFDNPKTDGWTINGVDPMS